MKKAYHHQDVNKLLSGVFKCVSYHCRDWGRLLKRRRCYCGWVMKKYRSAGKRLKILARKKEKRIIYLGRNRRAVVRSLHNGGAKKRQGEPHSLWGRSSGAPLSLIAPFLIILRE